MVSLPVGEGVVTYDPGGNDWRNFVNSNSPAGVNAPLKISTPNFIKSLVVSVVVFFGVAGAPLSLPVGLCGVGVGGTVCRGRGGSGGGVTGGTTGSGQGVASCSSCSSSIIGAVSGTAGSSGRAGVGGVTIGVGGVTTGAIGCAGLGGGIGGSGIAGAAWPASAGPGWPEYSKCIGSGWLKSPPQTKP